MPKARFPQYRRARNGIELFAGTILEHAHKAGVEIPSECGGLGRCGRCVVRIERGAECLNPRTDLERRHRLGPEERLACQARIVSPVADVTILVIYGGMASVKIVAGVWVDYMHIAKVDGDWKIVNVLWEMSPRG